MTQENNDFLLAKKAGVPLSVYLALKKDDSKVELLKTFITNSVEQDLTHENSFLLTRYAKHKNIDPTTGKDVDPGIPYHYKSELLHSETRRVYAIAKVMYGLTGNTLVFDNLEINKLSKKSISAIAKYIQEELSKAIAHAQLMKAIELLDKNHAKDLMRGVFYISPKVRHIEDMRGLRFMQIKKVIIPNGVTAIRAHAFESVSLESVSLPKTLSRIEDYAFRGCGLSEISIPKNKYLKNLGAKAFALNKITRISIPETFNVFDFDWFEGNPLEEISAPEKLRMYNQIPSVKINTRKNSIKKGAPN